MGKIVNIAFLTSHELRCPLTTIMGTTALLRESQDDENVKKLLPQLHDKSEEMDRVIRKMNDVLQETVKKTE